MKKLILFLLIISFSYVLNAQVVVKPNLNVVVGDTAGILYDGRFTVNSVDKRYGVSIYGNLSSNFIDKNLDTYGVFNFLNTTSIPLLTTSAGLPPGRSTIYNAIIGKRNAYHNAIFNQLSEIDTVNLYPVEMNGVVNSLNDTRSITNGFYNQIINPKSMEVYGLRNYINTVVPNVNFGSINGVYNDIETGGTGKTYGIQNIIKINQNTQGETYGIRTEIKLGENININSPSFNPPARYGIYSKVDSVLKPGGVLGYAGHFTGPVYVNGALLQASDSKLKDNIENIIDAVSIIKKLSPKKYDLKSEIGNGGARKHMGFIAQDVEKIMPELVYDVLEPQTKEVKKMTKVVQKAVEKRLNGETILVDKIVEIPQSIVESLAPKELKCINYTEMIPILLQAIKEQQAIIEQLQKDVEQLKKK